MIEININTIERALNLTFSNKSLLQRALTHRSYLNENADYPFEDNERLEFLGDAILDFVTGEYLYHRFPEMPEGRLTNLRSALVRTERLAEFAGQLDLGKFIFLSRGEDENGGRIREAVLCDAFEALIGAFYLDSGLDAARQFIHQIIEPALQIILARNAERDPKSLLQELSQSYYQITPTYRTVREDGPDHFKEFTVEAVVGDKVYGRGIGFSKQIAAQAAAEEALQNLQDEVIQMEEKGEIINDDLLLATVRQNILSKATN